MKIRLQRAGRAGIALVITLIMLAVTLVMAVAFLAISTRERGSVSTTTDAAHARLAADAALAHAEAQMMASMLASTNVYNFGMLVSTNFINSYGYLPKLGANPTNVDYYYSTNGGYAPGTFLSAADLQQAIANLHYLPRVPVFVPTNNGSGYDFRFYLDLNRNGQFDDSGLVPNTMFVNGIYVTNGLAAVQGDPQWIGVLEHPDAPHGPLNRFIARYAFLAVPVGNTLDVNGIYNDATLADMGSSFTTLNMKPGYDGFLRNEGVGTWELNLAAFLTDLNTNEWDNPNQLPYDYEEAIDQAHNNGHAFDDALSILRYRYNDNLYNQLTADQIFGTASGFQNIVDSYSVGTLMTTNFLPPPANYYNMPWSGADNTNHFFALADFYNENIFRPQGYNILSNTLVFPDRLMHAGTNHHASANLTQVPTYDRYTFYRMLAQLGTDTTPDYGKLNINYRNVMLNTNSPAENGYLNAAVNLGAVVPGMETNCYPWTAPDFFVNAADRLLHAYTANWYNANQVSFTNAFGNYSSNGVVFGVAPFGITNIPVLVNGRFVYTPSVQRLLQLAANIYDATTTNFYPSVFRPTFYQANGNVFINGYEYVTNVAGYTDIRFSMPTNAADFAAGRVLADNLNIYGVPWIIGAKKGFPNFNKYGVQEMVQINRHLQIVRPNTERFVFGWTNQQYIFNVGSSIGVQCWNSYANAYSNPVDIYVDYSSTMRMTNDFGAPDVAFYNYPLKYHLTVNNWAGTGLSAFNNTVNTNSFQMPLSINLQLLTNSVFYFGTSVPGLTGFWPDSYGWETSLHTFPFPNFGLLTTNRLRLIMLDGNHIIDYVQLNGPDGGQNINSLMVNKQTGASFANMWNTNVNANGVPWGIVSQIQVSDSDTDPNNRTKYWKDAYYTPSEVYGEMDGFATFMGLSEPFPLSANAQLNNAEAASLAAQVPYESQVVIPIYFSYQANDPLVHYLLSDLSFNGAEGGNNGPIAGVSVLYGDLSTPAQPNYFALNDRYQPWSIVNQMMGSGMGMVDTNAYNLAYKDPLVSKSDYWNFPTNPFPNVGWLGRVHRGTPWQTVFLKSTNLLYLNNSIANGLRTWTNWAGIMNATNVVDAENNAPVYDRWLFDLFTTEPDENATVGKLSVNQTGFAAWSALFSGLVVYTNATISNPSQSYYTIFPPAGPYFTNGFGGGPTNPLGTIWNNIQQIRALFPSQSFQHVGDVLATPALSDNSPFLQGARSAGTPISDAEYEWLPQQTLSLMTLGTPRYVVYCYGQALKPAPGGFVTGGTYAGMCTNYQVVSESATRAVVQVQNVTSNNPSIILKNLNPLPPDQ